MTYTCQPSACGSSTVTDSNVPVRPTLQSPSCAYSTQLQPSANLRSKDNQSNICSDLLIWYFCVFYQDFFSSWRIHIVHMNENRTSNKSCNCQLIFFSSLSCLSGSVIKANLERVWPAKRSEQPAWLVLVERKVSKRVWTQVLVWFSIGLKTRWGGL